MADWQNSPNSGYGAGPANPWGGGGSQTPGGMSGSGMPNDDGGLVDKAQHLAGDAREQVGRRVESGLQQGKTRVADTLGGVAHTLRQSSQQLGDQHGAAGQYVTRTADQMQRLSDYLRQTDVQDIVTRVEDVARRQPALFLGGMFAVGLLGARFLKSSQRQGDRQLPVPYTGGYADQRPASLYDTQASSGSAYGSQRDAQRDVQRESAYDRQRDSQYGGSQYGSAGTAGGAYGGWTGSTGGSTGGGSGTNAGGASGNAYDAGSAGRYATERDVTGSQRIVNEPGREYGRDAGQDRSASGYGGHAGASPTSPPGFGAEPFQGGTSGSTGGADRRATPSTTPGMPTRTPSASDAALGIGEREPRNDQP